MTCRFWNKVNKDGKTQPHCLELGPYWEWTAATFPNGYGSLNYAKKSSLAHRMSWELAQGKIPEGLLVLHKCDNPPCVNPKHLFIGTYADNTNDRNAKGRANPNPPRGTKHGLSKLTERDVIEIRRMWENGARQKEIAVKFGITRQNVSEVVNRHTWKHIR